MKVIDNWYMLVLASGQRFVGYGHIGLQYQFISAETGAETVVQSAHRIRNIESRA